MRKNLSILVITALLMSISCGATVKVTNSTSAELTCELTSDSSALGKNTAVIVAAGDINIDVKVKIAKSNELLYLFYWWDGAEDYASSTSDCLYFAADGTSSTISSADYSFRSAKQYTTSSNLVKNASITFPATTGKDYLYSGNLVIE